MCARWRIFEQVMTVRVELLDCLSHTKVRVDMKEFVSTLDIWSQTLLLEVPILDATYVY